MRAIEVDHHTGDGRVGAVEPQAHRANAVGVEREMFLLCIGERTGKDEYQAVRVDCSFDGRLNRARQDDLNGDIRAIALYLQLLNLSRAVSCALRSAE